MANFATSYKTRTNRHITDNKPKNRHAYIIHINPLYFCIQRRRAGSKHERRTNHPIRPAGTAQRKESAANGYGAGGKGCNARTDAATQG